MLYKNTIDQQIQAHLEAVYGDILDPDAIADLNAELVDIMRLESTNEPAEPRNLWTQRDSILITYADTITSKEQLPLQDLKDFLDKYVENDINSVHILPFFPYSSDDGFSVIDYFVVNKEHGTWREIRHIAEKYRLMSDLVINHCSSQSEWFDNFINNKEPGAGYFFTASPNDKLDNVVRPRASKLLRETETTAGRAHVWCTFGHDQVDLDFRNPEVLKQFCKIVRLYLDNGVKIFRLDAIAFLWKIVGTPCLNLPQTHEIVRLFRTLIEHAQNDAVILTETNLPNQENLEYFGNGNEAHWIYNFTLPPLLIHALITGTSRYLKQWMMSMPPAQNGTAYFNFIASHDGIGLRPAEGVLDDTELTTLTDTLARFGGKISMRTLDDGSSKPYEMNISLLDALKGDVNGEDQFGEQRFLCAHAIMFAVEGVPALYIQSLVAGGNDYQRMKETGKNRGINRRQWDYNTISDLLDDPSSHHHRLFTALKSILAVRTRQPAFHPNATQFTLQLGEDLFGFWRQSIDRQQSIFCISNLTRSDQNLALSDINLIGNKPWYDLLSNVHYPDHSATINLEPYHTVWISNFRYQSQTVSESERSRLELLAP